MEHFFLSSLAGFFLTGVVSFVIDLVKGDVFRKITLKDSVFGILGFIALLSYGYFLQDSTGLLTSRKLLQIGFGVLFGALIGLNIAESYRSPQRSWMNRHPKIITGLFSIILLFGLLAPYAAPILRKLQIVPTPWGPIEFTKFQSTKRLKLQNRIQSLPPNLDALKAVRNALSRDLAHRNNLTKEEDKNPNPWFKIDYPTERASTDIKNQVDSWKQIAKFYDLFLEPLHSCASKAYNTTGDRQIVAVHLQPVAWRMAQLLNGHTSEFILLKRTVNSSLHKLSAYSDPNCVDFDSLFGQDSQDISTHGVVNHPYYLMFLSIIYASIGNFDSAVHLFGIHDRKFQDSLNLSSIRADLSRIANLDTLEVLKQYRATISILERANIWLTFTYPNIVHSIDYCIPSNAIENEEVRKLRNRLYEGILNTKNNFAYEVATAYALANTYLRRKLEPELDKAIVYANQLSNELASWEKKKCAIFGDPNTTQANWHDTIGTVLLVDGEFLHSQDIDKLEKAENHFCNAKGILAISGSIDPVNSLQEINLHLEQVGILLGRQPNC